MQITYLIKPYQFIPREFYIELVEPGPCEWRIPWRATLVKCRNKRLLGDSFD